MNTRYNMINKNGDKRRVWKTKFLKKSFLDHIVQEFAAYNIVKNTMSIPEVGCVVSRCLKFFCTCHSGF
jgi:hypothetical protein